MAITSLIYQFGEFTLDTLKGCLFQGALEVKLRPKVYETLKYLVQNPGRLIAKPELMQAVWPDSFVTDDSLVQCTLELRRALEDHGQQLLKTVPRRGYLFNSGFPMPRPNSAGALQLPNLSSASMIAQHSLSDALADAMTCRFLAPLSLDAPSKFARFASCWFARTFVC